MNTKARSQRGAAALGATLLLLVVLAIVVGFASRNAIFEQRSAANQLRATRAFEAAEAGLDWAQAMLNHAAAIDAACEPSATPGETTFRDRLLAYDPATRRFEPRPTLQAACVLTDDGWTCSCPRSGAPTLATPSGSGLHPAFVVRFAAAPRSGMVQVVATGCEHVAPDCLATATPVGSARVQATLALLPALATLPKAALTARGDIVATGALALGNTDAASGGLTAQAGGSIALPLARLTTLPDVPAPASLSAHAATLASTDADRLATRLLGVDLARWQQLPDVRRVACAAECSADLALAQGANAEHQRLWVEGDLALNGAATFGTPERPLLIVVSGQVRLGAGITIHGAIVGLAANWDTSSSADGQLRGAFIALGSVAGNGTPALVYDPGVLARLAGQVGSFARVAGSWRDF